MNKSSFFLPSITNSLQAYKHLKDHISYAQEEVWVIGLNNLKTPTSTKKVFVGTVDKTIIHPREIIFELIKSKSSSYILCHSHPSGDPSPSKEDIAVTQKFKTISNLIQIDLNDHIIFARSSYYSFVDSNIL